MRQNKTIPESDSLQDEKWMGIWIRQTRLEKNWSQDGLCKGICAVSYLSKIEQGKVIPAPEILHALAAKLDSRWETAPDILAHFRELVEAQYRYIFTLNPTNRTEIAAKFQQSSAAMAASPFLLDRLLLEIWFGYRSHSELDNLRPFLGAMTSRQHQLYLMLTDSLASVQLYPSPYTCYWAGINAYEKGYYTHAVELLTRANSLAAEDGELYLQTSCRIFIGNCYANMLDVEQMQHHYHDSKMILTALTIISRLLSWKWEIFRLLISIFPTCPTHQRLICINWPSAVKNWVTGKRLLMHWNRYTRRVRNSRIKK